MKALSSTGYQNVNKLNEKYNILYCEITDMEEFDRFYHDFAVVYNHSEIISEEDMDYLSNLQNKVYE